MESRIASADHPVETLEPPVVRDQIICQPVEQFGMSGALALETKIIGGGDDSTTEVLLPNPVDNDTCKQVTRPPFGVGHPVG